MPTKRAKGVDEKNGIISLVIMFTSRAMIIKMFKMVHFLYYLLMATNSCDSLCIYLSSRERRY